MSFGMDILLEDPSISIIRNLGVMMRLCSANPDGYGDIAELETRKPIINTLPHILRHAKQNM
jgi:hypothetical protein